MQAPLPLASYVFILRKHLWLVLGTVAVVLAGGWFYGKTQKRVWEATALVMLQKEVGVPAGRETIVLGDDQRFVNDQSYRLRSDEDLARKVLEHLQATAASPDPAPAPGAAGGLAAPPAPEASLFRGLDPRDLPGMITVTAVPTTSFYQFSVRAGDPQVCTGLVNGYAHVFARTFAEERGRQVQEFVAGKEAVRKQRQEALKKVDEEIEKFKKDHKDIDFDAGAGPGAGASGSAEGRRPGSADKEEADFYRKALAAERSSLTALEQQRQSAEKALHAAGLRFVEDPETGYTLAPLPKNGSDGPVAAELGDPRLSERIQALEVVAKDEGVRKVKEAIDAAETIDRSLAATGKSEGHGERVAARREIELQRRALIRCTEAALVNLAERVVQSEKVVADYEDKVRALEIRVAATNVALADYETLRKKRDSAQAGVEETSKIIVDAEGLRKRFEEGGGTVRVFKYARAGDSQLVAPNKPVIYLTAVVAALLLAAGLAYVLEYLDDTVKTREDFDRLVRLPFLGFVPHIREEDGRPRELVVARGKTGTPEVESFRALRTGIQFSRPDREIRSFLVTSAGPGEGKTTVSMNLAAAFTGSRGRVLLVDADLRRARVHKALGIENARGLTNVLVGEATLEEAVQRSSVEGLDVLASGPIPPNPAEVLGSERMQELLREAAGRWDRVVVDSPPIVAVTDPSLLAKSVDGVFLVISVGKTSIRTIQRARETLATVGVAIHGSILNNADVKISGYAQTYGGYGYGYGYGYGSK